MQWSVERACQFPKERLLCRVVCEMSTADMQGFRYSSFSNTSLRSQYLFGRFNVDGVKTHYGFSSPPSGPFYLTTGLMFLDLRIATMCKADCHKSNQDLLPIWTLSFLLLLFAGEFLRRDGGSIPCDEGLPHPLSILCDAEVISPEAPFEQARLCDLVHSTEDPTCFVWKRKILPVYRICNESS